MAQRPRLPVALKPEPNRPPEVMSPPPNTGTEEIVRSPAKTGSFLVYEMLITAFQRSLFEPMVKS